MHNDPRRRLLEEGVVGFPEAAKFLGVSREKVHRMVKEGAFPSVRVACHRRIPVRALMDYLMEDLRLPAPWAERLGIPSIFI